MKRIIAITGIILLTLGMFSCENGDWSYPDFDYTTSYFPYQFPVRTLVLGDYYFDNANDNALKFMIGARMGGVYRNKENITVGIAVDNALTDSLYDAATGARLLPLPSNYYTLSSTSQIIIPNGREFGMVEVQLNQAFLDDTLTIGKKYVVPLKITSSTTDSILLGYSLNVNPDLRVAGEWIKPPKNFTLFCINYVNQYHGKYLLRGKDVVTDTDADTVVETIVYRKKYVEQDELAEMRTYREHSVTYVNNVRKTPASPGKFTMIVPFDTNGNATLTHLPGTDYVITGTAKYVKDGDTWGGLPRDAVYMSYQIDQPPYTHTVTDTLVFRDKMVVFQEYSPLVKKPL
jgi:hypothetical protein